MDQEILSRLRPHQILLLFFSFKILILEIDKEKDYEYKIFGHFNNKSLGAMRIGSAALSLAYLSSGKIDGFWTRGLNSWDIVAGLCILKEAGGKYSDEDGNLFKYKNFLVASNSVLHTQILKEINSLKK